MHFCLSKIMKSEYLKLAFSDHEFHSSKPQYNRRGGDTPPLQCSLDVTTFGDDVNRFAQIKN